MVLQLFCRLRRVSKCQAQSHGTNWKRLWRRISPNSFYIEGKSEVPQKLRVCSWSEEEMCLESGSLNFRSPHFQSLDSQSLSLKKCPHVEIWSLIIDLPEVSFFPISQAWDYQVFFSIWAFILQYAFKTVLLPRDICKWLGTRSLGYQWPHLLFCGLYRSYQFWP